MIFIAFQFFPTKGSAGSAKSQYNSPEHNAAGDKIQMLLLQQRVYHRAHDSHKNLGLPLGH